MKREWKSAMMDNRPLCSACRSPTAATTMPIVFHISEARANHGWWETKHGKASVKIARQMARGDELTSMTR